MEADITSIFERFKNKFLGIKHKRDNSLPIYSSENKPISYLID